MRPTGRLDLEAISPLVTISKAYQTFNVLTRVLYSNRYLVKSMFTLSSSRVKIVLIGSLAFLSSLTCSGARFANLLWQLKQCKRHDIFYFN